MKSLRDENQNAFHRNTNFPYKIRSPTTKASKISMFPTLLEQCFPNYRFNRKNRIEKGECATSKIKYCCNFTHTRTHTASESRMKILEY